MIGIMSPLWSLTMHTILFHCAGSDNGEYGLPHFARKGHEDEKGHKQLYSLYGAIVHGMFTKVGGP
jgi:hypothetical protein